MVALDLEKQMHYKVVSHQSDIGKTYLYAKDPYETKHRLLINKKKGLGLKNWNDFKAFNLSIQIRNAK